MDIGVKHRRPYETKVHFLVTQFSPISSYFDFIVLRSRLHSRPSVTSRDLGGSDVSETKMSGNTPPTVSAWGVGCSVLSFRCSVLVREEDLVEGD